LYQDIQAIDKQARSVANIPKHNRKKERESDDCENSRVDFFVPGDSIGRYNLLKHIGKSICLKVSRRICIFRGLMLLKLGNWQMWRINFQIVQH